MGGLGSRDYEPWTPSSTLGLLSFSITFCTISLATAVVNAHTNIDIESFGLAKILIVHWKTFTNNLSSKSHKMLQQTFLATGPHALPFTPNASGTNCHIVGTKSQSKGLHGTMGRLRSNKILHVTCYYCMNLMHQIYSLNISTP